MGREALSRLRRDRPLGPALLALSLAGCAPAEPPAAPPAPRAAPVAAPVAASPAVEPGPRFASPAAPAPAFADPERRAKLVALGPRLEAHFAERLAKTEVPGMAVGLVVDGELVWSKGYGVRSLDGKEPVDADTQFRVGSVTKSFTGLALLQQRDAGKVGLDDPAERYLPELRGLVYPTRDAPRVTLRHLVTHQAGLPHDPPVDVDETHEADEGKVLASLQGLALDAAPGVESRYSNVGFALAGAIVARASGEPYRQYVAAHVLRPLGMTSSGFAPDPSRLALGYHLEGKARVHPKLLRLGGLDPAGGLFSTVRDLARYAALELSAWPPRDDDESPVLRRSSLREAQRMAVWWSLDVFPRVEGKRQRATAAGYGYGWVTEQTCDWDVAVWHNGALSDGYHAVVFTLPESGVAFVALENLDDPEQALEQAVRDAARLLGEAGALTKRVFTPTPTQIAARDAVESLERRWDDALAARAFAPGTEELVGLVKKGFAADAVTHGACHVDATKTPDDARQLSWEVACDRGGISFRLALDAAGRVSALWGEDWLPPYPRLADVAARLAGWIGAKDQRALEGLAQKPALGAIRAQLDAAGASHAGCKLTRAERFGDGASGRFAVACAKGDPLELRAGLDAATGRLASVTLVAPAVEGRRCP